MQVDFKFGIDQLVYIPGDKKITGKVIGLFLGRGTSVNRIMVQYVNGNGSVCEDWFDEDLLTAV